jgi:hypothetical protein
MTQARSEMPMFGWRETAKNLPVDQITNMSLADWGKFIETSTTFKFRDAPNSF